MATSTAAIDAATGNAKKPAAAIFLSGMYCCTERRQGVAKATGKGYDLHFLTFHLPRLNSKPLTVDISVPPELADKLPAFERDKSYLLPVNVRANDRNVSFSLAADYPIAPSPMY